MSFFRSFAIAAAAVVMTTGMAHAQDILMPYVQGGSFASPPQPGQPITLNLRGYFPYPCGVILDTSGVATDSIMPEPTVEFTIRPAAGACTDTALSWQRSFTIPPLSEGLHTLTLVEAYYTSSGSWEVARRSWNIWVGTPPPPPPPPPPPLYAYFTTSPDPLNDHEPAHVTIHGYFPWQCGEIVSSTITGQTQVDVTMRERACAGSDSVTQWAQTFDFGVLAAGNYNLVINVRDAADPSVAHVYGAWFTVWGPQPPPPPPGPPPHAGPLFTGMSTIPAQPKTSEPTWLIVEGFAPYDCAFMTDDRIVPPYDVQFTVHPGNPGCWPDTTWAYRMTFNLGLVPAGHHTVGISIRDAGAPDSLAIHHYDAAFDVLDTGPPVPPAPPGDSVKATVPNPFAQQTQFGVIVPGPTRLEVAILDIQGRIVRKIWNGDVVAAGTWNFSWDGRRDDGSRARPGLYFYRVVRPGRVESRRVVLLGR